MLRASFWRRNCAGCAGQNRRLFRKVARWVSPAEWIFEELFGASGSSHSMGERDRALRFTNSDLAQRLVRSLRGRSQKARALAGVSLRKQHIAPEDG